MEIKLNGRVKTRPYRKNNPHKKIINKKLKHYGDIMTQKINLAELLPFIEEAFSRGAEFKLPITGTSMNPLLYQGRDYVKIVKPQLPLAVGDIPLYRRDDGLFVLHRVVKIKSNGEYVMCGDNQFLLEEGITDKHIIGVVKTIIRDGREFDVDSDEWYLKFKKKYVKNVKTRYLKQRLRHKATTMVTSDGIDNETLHNQEEVMKADMLSVGEILIGAVSAAINEKTFDFPENTNFKKLYKLADMHRIAPFIATQVAECDFADDEIKNIFKKALFKATVRYSAQVREAEELSKELSENKVPHCFLKGTKVSKYYKHPETRFMIDMDVYVEEEKMSVAHDIMIGRGYKVAGGGGEKDVAYTKPPFHGFEIHRELKYDYEKDYEYYKSAFERLVTEDGYVLNMTDEDFYVYILSHTAHHFAGSGIGIKSIIDHYYLRKGLKPLCDPEKLEDGFSKTGLTEFNFKMNELCDYWFNGGEADSAVKEMAEFIILSGIFGNDKNRYLARLIRENQKQNKYTYYLRRVFPTLKTMRVRYPVLKKLTFLLPIFWGVRLISSILAPSKLLSETKLVNSVQDGEKERQESFLKNIGL